MADSNLVLTLELPENFLKELDAVIKDELAIAQKKWKIKLSPEEREIVLKNAYAQTRLKTSTIARHSWNLEEKLTMRIPYKKNSNMTLRIGEKPTRNLVDLIITKDGWVIASEESESPTPLENLLEKQIQTIFTWARTAVFYGVGSFRSH